MSLAQPDAGSIRRPSRDANAPFAADHRSRPDAVTARIAEAQYGVVSREQALAAGMSSAQISRRLRSGRLVHLFPRIYSVAGVPSSWEQRVMAACLSGGRETAASHRSAARIHGLDGFEHDIVEIAGPRHRDLPGVSWHRSPLLPIDVTVRRAIPVTSVERTLVDLGSVVLEASVEDALDSALRQRKTTVPRLVAAVGRLGGKGRAGAGVLRALLLSRDGTQAVSESRFETRLHRLLRAARLPTPTPVRQHIVRCEGRFVARCDFAFPDKQVAIEAMSLRWHLGRKAVLRDIERRNALVAVGWKILEVTWEAMTERPHAVIGLIAHALGYPTLLPRDESG